MSILIISECDTTNKCIITTNNLLDISNVLDKNIDIEYLITQCNLHQDDRDIFKIKSGYVDIFEYIINEFSDNITFNLNYKFDHVFIVYGYFEYCK